MEKKSNGLWDMMKGFHEPVDGKFNMDIIKKEYEQFTRYRPGNAPELMCYVPQYGTAEEQEQQRKEISGKLGGIKVLTNEEWEEQNTL